jgi:hypothetical protein
MPLSSFFSYFLCTEWMHKCLGSPFTLGYNANGQPIFDDATVNTPTTIQIAASRQFEPT